GDVVGLIDESAAPAEQKPAPAAEESAPAAPKGEAPPAEAGAEEAAAEDERGRVSPVARKLAEEKGIDLAQVKGSGAHGRVVKEDIERHLSAEAPTEIKPPAEKPAEAPAPAPTAAPSLPLSQARNEQ